MIKKKVFILNTMKGHISKVFSYIAYIRNKCLKQNLLTHQIIQYNVNDNYNIKTNNTLLSLMYNMYIYRLRTPRRML